MTRMTRILVWILACLAGLVVLLAAVVGAFAFHTLYDARLWYDACRVAGVTPEFYENITGRASRAFPPAEQGSAFDLKPKLMEWFEREAAKMTTEAEKLALMDATFRAVPMQFTWARRSVTPSYDGKQETITYGFAYRDRDDLQMRVLNYVSFGVEWLVDENGKLGEFYRISKRHPTVMLSRAFERARSDVQPLCPQPAKQVPPSSFRP
jgi:hypothetical protein